jgi:hypothetical protein
MNDTEKPYKCMMHYDSSVSGVWIGFGRDLQPACGQSECIRVTNYSDVVDCMKCKDILAE